MRMMCMMRMPWNGEGKVHQFIERQAPILRISSQELLVAKDMLGLSTTIMFMTRRKVPIYRFSDIWEMKGSEELLSTPKKKQV